MNLCLCPNAVASLAGPELAGPGPPDQTHANEETHLFLSIQLLSLHLQMDGMLLGEGMCLGTHLQAPNLCWNWGLAERRKAEPFI